MGIRATAKGVRLEGADEGHIEVRLDRVLQAQRPENAVHDHAAIAFIRDVFRSAVERGENAARFAGGGLVGACPFAGHRWLGGIRRRVLCHAIKRLGHRQNLTIRGFAHVAARLHPDVLHTTENRMRSLVRHDGDARALLVIGAVVAHPGLTEHLMTKTQFIAADLAIKGILSVGIILRCLETMRRRAQSDHRAASCKVGVKVLHQLRRKLLKAQEDHREIRCVQHLHARHVCNFARHNVAFLVDVEQHRAFEPLMLGQQTRDGRQ